MYTIYQAARSVVADAKTAPGWLEAMLVTIEQLDKLLIEVASLADFAELARAADEEATWWLTAGDERAVLVEWDKAARRMMLSVEIGTVPETGRDDVLERALHYNQDWRRNGGARMGLIPEDGSLQLMIDLHPDEFEPSHLVEISTGLLDTAATWLGELETAVEAAEESEDLSSPGDPPPPGSVLA